MQRESSPPLPSGLVLLLALAPVLVAGDSTLKALGLALAALVTLLVVRLIATAFGNRRLEEVHLGAIAVLVAAVTGTIDRAGAAFLPELRAAVGSDLWLVAATSLLLAGADRSALRPWPAWLAAAAGFALALVGLGAAREWLGHAVPLARLPAGALLLLGAVLAAMRAARRPPVPAARAPAAPRDAPQ